MYPQFALVGAGAAPTTQISAVGTTDDHPLLKSVVPLSKPPPADGSIKTVCAPSHDVSSKVHHKKIFFIV